MDHWTDGHRTPEHHNRRTKCRWKQSMQRWQLENWVSGYCRYPGTQTASWRVPAACRLPAGTEPLQQKERRKRTAARSFEGRKEGEKEKQALQQRDRDVTSQCVWLCGLWDGDVTHTHITRVQEPHTWLWVCNVEREIREAVLHRLDSNCGYNGCSLSSCLLTQCVSPSEHAQWECNINNTAIKVNKKTNKSQIN